MKSIFKKVFLLLVLTFAFNYSHASGQFMMESPLIGKKAPDFTLDSTSGEKVNLVKYSAGQNTILFFWATWCPHCREQLKELNKHIKELEAKNIKLVVVDVGETSKQVMNHLTREKIALNVVLDADEKVSESYALIGVPTFFFVNKEGNVLAVEHAYPDNLEVIFGK